MSFVLRKYQEEAVQAAIDFFNRPSNGNGLISIFTGAGKSLIIAEIAKRLKQPVIVTCPSKEILEQNYAKYTTYGFKASIYSASAGKKQISDVTFVTIGSVVNKPDLFRNFKYIIGDEAHFFSAKGGMYRDFIKALNNPKIVGLSATCYRLSTDGFGGSMLKFLTRTRPRIFNELIYYVQNKDLFDAGYLAKIEYYSIPGFDTGQVKLNSTGADFDEDSLKAYYQRINFPASLTRVVESLMKVRKNVLVFTRFVEESYALAANVNGVVVLTGETPKKEREDIWKKYFSGEIKCLTNVGVAVTGVDFPELETVVIARPTMSLALYCQMIGRGVRIQPTKKSTWVVDMGDNFRLFGRVEDLMIKTEGNGKWYIDSNGKKLTNVYYER